MTVDLLSPGFNNIVVMDLGLLPTLLLRTAYQLYCTKAPQTYLGTLYVYFSLLAHFLFASHLCTA
jgi:membrane-anchored protein YejM (alkaline phosphatase superfamily)